MICAPSDEIRFEHRLRFRKPLKQVWHEMAESKQIFRKPANHVREGQ